MDPCAALLMLADARLPAGGHAHSGGLEAAVTAGTVTDVGSLEAFLRGRLRTVGVVTAGLAAAACRRAGAAGTALGAHGPDVAEAAAAHVHLVNADETVDIRRGEAGASTGAAWALLDAEADARTPSPAQRDASRRQGRALLRAARAAWPAPWLTFLSGAGEAPHHAVVLGAAAAAAGCTPAEAALVAAYLSVSGPASAAVRLLALDPIEVNAVLARLAPAIGDAASRASATAAGPLADLPFSSAPALDLLAEAHARTEVSLFAS